MNPLGLQMRMIHIISLDTANASPFLRPPIISREHDPINDLTISSRALDQDIFNAWMNQPRIANFGKLAEPRPVLDAQLAKLDSDRHTYPLTACIDADPTDYYETHCAKKDQRSPYSEANDYDRGGPGAVDDPAPLGRRRTGAHFCTLNQTRFLDDFRTAQLPAVGAPAE